MDKKKGIAIAVSIIFAFGFYFLYTNMVTYWDAYAYEIDKTTEIDPDRTLELTSQELEEYPDLAAKIAEAGEDGWGMMTFDEGNSFYEFEDLMEARGEDFFMDYIFLQVDGETYSVAFTSYGGMDTEPIYLVLAGVSGLAAVILVSTEALSYIKARK